MIAKLLLPAGLAFIMFSIGLTLRGNDFTRLFKQPLAILIGLFCQLLMLPVLAFALLYFWTIDPVLSVGVMILAASPGGITSNLLTQYAGGDTALSISLTAISSLAGMISIPVIVVFSINYFSDLSTPIELPVWRMILGIFAVSTLPVLIGMAINHNNSRLADRIEGFARPLSIVTFGLIVIGAFASQWSAMMSNLPVIGLLIFVLNVTIMALGFGLAKFAHTGTAAAKAISLEGGLQNGAIGIFVATTLVGNATLAIPSITYALVMNASALGFIITSRFLLRPPQNSTSI